jgi:hypothetical protein
LNYVPATALLFLLLPLRAQTLEPRLEKGNLRGSLLDWKFLDARTLQRLRNGQTVTLDFQLQLIDGAKTVNRAIERFVLSYDLWEENYSAVQLTQAAPRTPAYATSRLKQETLANWCLGRIKIPVTLMDKDRKMTLQLEVRSAGLNLPNPLRAQGVIDLAALVEIFSRPPDPKEMRFTAQSQPFTLGALPALTP